MALQCDEGWLEPDGWKGGGNEIRSLIPAVLLLDIPFTEYL